MAFSGAAVNGLERCMLDFGGRRTGLGYMNSTCERANQGSSSSSSSSSSSLSQVLFLNFVDYEVRWCLLLLRVSRICLTVKVERASSIGIWQKCRRQAAI